MIIELAVIFPEWVITTLTTTGTALLGVIGKYIWDYVMAKKEVRSNRVENLEKLRGSLKEAKQLYDMQSKMVRRLALSISFRTNQPIGENMDSFFVSNYDKMTDEEMDMFVMIRGISCNSLKRSIEFLLEWIEKNSEFKTNSVKQLKKSTGPLLSEKLIQLELLFNLWQDKYSVIMGNEKHSHIHFSKESDQIIPFEIDGILIESIDELKSSKHLFSSRKR